MRRGRRPGLPAAAVAAAALLAAAGPATAAQATRTSGGVSATLTWTGSFQDAGPVSLTVTRAGVATTFSGLQSDPTGAGKVHANPIGSTYSPIPSDPLRVRDLDGDGEPEVIVRLFSGGAHCCEVSSVASFDATAGAYRLIAQTFNDAGWVLHDLGGTASPEFRSWDHRWAYWGGPYAGSPRPLQIWSFAGGAFHDVTRSFPAQLRRDQARQLSSVAQARRQGVSPRGLFAAYIADGYSLGEPAAALARIRAIDHAPGRSRFLRALHNQLVRTGYTKPLPRAVAVRP